MDINTLKAITFITSTATEELTILHWIAILNSIYKDGIPEECHFSDAINYYVMKFPGFTERAQDVTQEAYDKLYEDFMTYIFNMIGFKNGMDTIGKSKKKNADYVKTDK